MNSKENKAPKKKKNRVWKQHSRGIHVNMGAPCMVRWWWCLKMQWPHYTERPRQSINVTVSQFRPSWHIRTSISYQIKQNLCHGSKESEMNTVQIQTINIECTRDFQGIQKRNKNFRT